MGILWMKQVVRSLNDGDLFYVTVYFYIAYSVTEVCFWLDA